MHVRKGRERGRKQVGLVLLLLTAMLVVVAAGHGGTGSKPDASAANARSGASGGFGEVYKAKTATLKKTLFNAKLLPTNKTARNIALAGFGRADKKVNYNLALKCWKNNGCSTGTGGKLTVAYVERFGENVYRQMSKMEFILQALTYPEVGKIIYTSAHSDPAQALTDFRAAISQHVNVIVTYPDFGDAMLPVFKEATKAGIPVATYAWGYVTGPGSNYLTVVGEDTCRLGKAYAKVMNRQVKSGNIAFLGGFPGNPLVSGLAEVRAAGAQPEHPCRRDRADELGSVEGPAGRRRNPREVSPNIKGWSYEYGLGMAQGAFAAYKAAGKPFNAVLTLRTDDVGMGCAAQNLHNPKLKVYYYTAGNSQIRVAFTAAMMKLKGAKIPPKIVFPIQLQNQAKRNSCVKGYPQEASATSLVPLALLKRMYP